MSIRNYLVKMHNKLSSLLIQVNEEEWRTYSEFTEQFNLLIRSEKSSRKLYKIPMNINEFRNRYSKVNNSDEGSAMVGGVGDEKDNYKLNITE